MRSMFTPLVVCAAVVLGAPPVSSQGAPPPLPVTVAPPLAKRITQWDEYSGRFEAVNNVEVRARVSGLIDKINFKDGQIVKAGELLFTIDKRPFEIAVAIARAEIARSNAQIGLGEAEVARAAPLVKSGIVTQRDFDQRQANLNVARASLQAAEANVKMAELNLEWAEVNAPISGRVSDRRVDAGNLVSGGQSGAATVLTNIVSLDPIHFVFDASEADYLRYTRLGRAGARPTSREVENPVRIKLSDEEEWTREGKMDFVDNQLNPRSGTMRGRALVENGDQVLSPGLFGKLRLFGGDVDALLIPDASIVADQARKIVLVVGADNVIVGKPVELGPIVDGLRVVKSGLDVGDRVVIEGIANPAVRQGAKVEPREGEIKTAAK